jgi:hypothetical protein
MCSPSGTSHHRRQEPDQESAAVIDRADVPAFLAANLETDEVVRSRADTYEAVLAVTDRRVVVATEDRVAMAIPIDGLRRIQFDIERDRPATMVMVPEQAQYEAQVLTVRPGQYEAVAGALVTIANTFAAQGSRSDRPS